jgi:hypothetical protein
MYGGEGEAGDDGVPQGGGIFGLVAVPASLKGFVELALILGNADFSGFGKRAAKETIERLATQGAKDLGKAGADAGLPVLRAELASEARKEAAKATKVATEKMATNKKTAAAWKKASKEEKAAFQRKVFYDHVDKLYREAEKAAKEARKQAEAILKRNPKNAAAEARRSAAETMEEAMEVKPVAGRLPINHEYAGKAFPADKLPAKYRSKGLQFTPQGHPDFSPFARKLPNGSTSVKIKYTGGRRADSRAANIAAGFRQPPPLDHIWHHHEDMETMFLIPLELHVAVKHAGGVSTYKHVMGVAKYGK